MGDIGIFSRELHGEVLEGIVLRHDVEVVYNFGFENPKDAKG